MNNERPDEILNMIIQVTRDDIHLDYLKFGEPKYSKNIYLGLNEFDTIKALCSYDFENAADIINGYPVIKVDHKHFFKFY